MSKEKAIVAVGLHGIYAFLAFEGDRLEFEIDNLSASPNDVIGDGAFPSEVVDTYFRRESL